MKIDFVYSIYNEISEYVTMITHPKDYSFLRSVVWNPLFILKGCINRKKNLIRAKKSWKPIESDVSKAFRNLNLKLKEEVITCYVHNTGCEGGFNVDSNRIHVRISRVNEGEFLGAVIHELVHLATTKKGQDYTEGENITDSYLAKKPLSDILKRMAGISRI